MKRELILIMSSSLLFGAAYKLPEQSLSGTALSAANVASCRGADCSYYNSANISFLEDKSYIEAGLTYIHLPSIEFEGYHNLFGQKVRADAKSRVENIVIPYFHYVSKEYGKFRYSFSLTFPGGLRKRWDAPVQKLYAQEFDLKTFQLTPSVAYRVNDNLSLSIGANIIYSEGKVVSDGSDINIPLKREMEGDSIDYGFNIGAALRLDSGWKMALNYRSKTTLSEEGKANLYIGLVGKRYDASVDIYLPATLTFAIAKDFYNTTLEFVYERTFWSSYEYLDFNYNPPIESATLAAVFDRPILKDWKDTNTFRVGVKYRYSNRLTLMGGYSYDETPIPQETLSYELPDSDAHIFSTGFKYQYSSNLSFGAAILYDYKKERRVVNDLIDGTFKEGGALLVTTGLEYRF
ncbi:MAG: long-chain fatty acid transporter [Epsilonproteobacteria bacterium]|nr:long-chain fatty acid transporter [Campylobacterota bacterium]